MVVAAAAARPATRLGLRALGLHVRGVEGVAEELERLVEDAHDQAKEHGACIIQFEKCIISQKKGYPLKYSK